MTDVVIAPRRENPSSDTESVVAGGWFQIRPSKAYVAGGQWVQAVWSDPVQLTGTAVTVKLDPLADIPYELYMELPDGRNGPKKKVNEFRFVVGAGPVGWETLTQTTGPGGDPVLPGVLESRVTALETNFGGVSGGATTLAGITNMSPFARLLNTDTTNIAMLSRLTAVGSASPTFTGTLTAANVTITGTVSLVDGSLAIADTSGLQTALDLKAPVASPAFTGNPTAPTPTAGDNDTSIATTAFVTTAVAAVTGGGGAPLVSPNFSGNPTAPTPTAGDNDTSIATTAFVQTALAGVPSQTVLDDLTTLVTSLTARVQELEENGANLAVFFGAAAPRTNPVTGGVLNAGTYGLFLTDGTPPANAVTNDIILNRVSI